jgi:DNA-binding MarR family transcriptional regulator
VLIRITTAGRAAMEESHRRRFARFRAITEPLSDRDLTDLRRIIQVIVNGTASQGDAHD